MTRPRGGVENFFFCLRKGNPGSAQNPFLQDQSKNVRIPALKTEPAPYELFHERCTAGDAKNGKKRAKDIDYPQATLRKIQQKSTNLLH